MAVTIGPPRWVKPQLTRLVEEAPAGKEWLHEIKYDGYRLHARIEGKQVALLTRTGLDWTHRYRRTAETLSSLKLESAYLDGELCAFDADGVPVFSRLQAAMDEGRTDQLVYVVFDVLHLNGKDLSALPLVDRKQVLEKALGAERPGLRYSGPSIGDGHRFLAEACKARLEGIISKRLDQPYAPGNRGIWLKAKCLNREEFVVVGWSDPAGSRSYIGALLLGYYDTTGRLHYAGRAGTGLSGAELMRLHALLTPLQVQKMPMAARRRARAGSVRRCSSQRCTGFDHRSSWR
jgi:bifunctional non-homologous end joining protein LigD